MKNLKITYGDAVLWDAPVGSLEWHDSENGVKVDGRVSAKPTSSPAARGGGILDMLAKASKAKTSQVAEAKREAYEAGGVADCNTPIVETVEPELDVTA
jgi:hypothetical protein